MRVNEMFLSCQGEGPDCGVPAVFVRLQGCNIMCSWCDTKYALGRGVSSNAMSRRATVHSVATYAKELNEGRDVSLAIITGGEPLLQEAEVGQLVTELRQNFRRVAIETNGTLPRPSWWQAVTWDVDRKCPSSGVDLFDSSWLTIGRANRVKFAVANELDLQFILGVLPEFDGPLKPTLLVSPILPMMSGWLPGVWNFCMQHNLRFSFQLHKVVFGNARGV